MEPSKLVGQSRCVLTAVALQDHLTRQYSLHQPGPQPTTKHPPTATAACGRCGKHSRKPFLLAGAGTNKHTNNTNNKPSATVIRNSAHTQSQKITNSRRKYENSRRKPSIKLEEKEFVLDPAPRALSLAEKLGLVDGPPQRLSEAQWLEVKINSNVRGDSKQPCPICQDTFSTYNQQVLLSCSHTFHRNCLQSVEKFSGHKQCPLCRNHDYQTRVIFEGAKCFRHKAATKIQAVWKGYKVRKWYYSHRQKFPPKHPLLRQKHYQDKLSLLTDHMIQSCDQSGIGAESVIAEADVAIAEARNVMRSLALHLEQDESTSDRWSTIRERAQEHITSECPVCLVGFHLPHTLTVSRPVAVLSCSHLLHLPCVEALERFSMATSPPLCPLCREPYTRQLL